MADEPQDVQAGEITPEDFDGVQDSKTDSSPEKETKEEVKAEAKTETKEEPAKEAEGKEEVTPPDLPTKADKEDTPEEKSDGEVDKPEEIQPTKADERKARLNTEIRDLVAQRNALKEQVQRANSEVYQPATEQELVDEGMSTTDAKVEAMRQNLEMRDYNERVAEAQLTIESESNRVLTDFAWANPRSGADVYKQELAEEAAALLQQNLITDPNTGQIIGSNISPYQLYKTLDRASGISAVQGQIKGQEAAERQLANVDANSSVAPPKKAEDPLAKLWEGDL